MSFPCLPPRRGLAPFLVDLSDQFPISQPVENLNAFWKTAYALRDFVCRLFQSLSSLFCDQTDIALQEKIANFLHEKIVQEFTKSASTPESSQAPLNDETSTEAPNPNLISNLSKIAKWIIASKIHFVELKIGVLKEGCREITVVPIIGKISFAVQAQ